MQIFPIILLILAILIELVNAISYGFANNGEALGDLYFDVFVKLFNIASLLLSALATLLSAVLLVRKQYTSMALGIAITFLGAFASAVFMAWTAVNFL
jgi:hypothetical protein